MLILLSTYSAIAPGLTASFHGSGGVEPYTYAVLPGGAGGTINATTGDYQSPLVMNPSPLKSYDVIAVTDATGFAAELRILVADPLFLFCEILRQELGLADDQVYIWNQKINERNDEKMYIAIRMLSAKPFGNTRKSESGVGLDSVQSLNMNTTLSLNIKSRSTEALLRKEEVLMALAGQYAQTQQEKNSFLIGKLPAGGQFIDLSNIDGSAIPYHFNISINMQYFVRKIKPTAYFDTFAAATVVTEP